MMKRAMVGMVMLMGVALGAQQARSAESDVPSSPRPQIPDHTFTITDYGAKGDGATMSTGAIENAIAACKSAGGGVVVVPRGKFLTGPFFFISRMNLRLDEGATLLFTDDAQAYPVKSNRHQHAITAEKCHDIAITGKGVIDGNGEKWWVAFRKIKGTPQQNRDPRRPNLVDMDRCQRVLVQDVTLRNSPNFHLVPRDCQDVTIEGIHITAPGKAPNTDGIDPSGWNYLITRCQIDVGDDCIAIKPQGRPVDGKPSCENFFITDCAFRHGHGLSIGGQTPGGMKHMIVRNCTFDGTDAGIRMKASRTEGGLVEDLTYDNLAMKNVKVVLFITSYYPNNITPKEPAKDPARPITATTPTWRDIRISNLHAVDCEEAGRIFGLPESPVVDLVLSNVTIKAKKGLQIYNAKQIELKNCHVTAQQGAAFIVDNAQVTGLPANAVAQ
jgi:polygalacturonase